MGDERGFIPSHGGYDSLVAYQKAQVVYDATVHFCARFLEKRDRTYDQMVQAARSGKQNIVEGSMASGTSRETEIKLTGVARASLEELLEDYRDFLRSRGAPLWAKDSKEALYVRRLSEGATPFRKRGKNETYVTDETYEGGESKDATTNGWPTANASAPENPTAPTVHQGHSSHVSHSSHSPYEHFRPFIETRPPEVVANIIICLIHQTNYLLDRQLRRLQKEFLEHGGLREAMTRARLAEREKQRRGGR